MENLALWLSLGMSTLSIVLAVASALVSWRAASRYTQLRKWSRGQLTTPPSASRLNALDAEIAELHSTLSKLTTTTKRLSSRHGMQEVRGRQLNEPPPVGASKAELRLFYAEQLRRRGQQPLPMEPNNGADT